MQLATRIRERREALDKMSQSEAARRLGVSLRTWQRYEDEDEADNVGALKRLDDIASALETTPAALLGYEADPVQDGSVEGRLERIEAAMATLQSAIGQLVSELASDPARVRRAADELIEQELLGPSSPEAAPRRKSRRRPRRS